MKCTYHEQSLCHSCNLIDQGYTDTLLQKEKQLREHFPDFHSCLKPAIGLDDCKGSRNKAKFAVFSQPCGDITFGFTRRDGSHQELESCILHAAGINALLPALKAVLKKYNITPYDIQTRKGELKFVLISTSANSLSTDILLRLVLRSTNSLTHLKKAAAELLTLPLNIKVITANIQPVHQAVLEGDKEYILTDTPYIIHRFDEFQLALGARSFFQVTPAIAKQLYCAAAGQIAIDKPDSIIDLYCGVGAFSFYASRFCEDVTGVEISTEAIHCANISAGLNNSNIAFYASDVEAFLLKQPRKYEAVMINPPRRGLNPVIIKSIKAIEPEFIYYSSCNVETLARDFKALSDDYEMTSLQLFDMFPYTSHFETLMCLTRKKCLI